jgi:hypothetical protein
MAPFGLLQTLELRRVNLLDVYIRPLLFLTSLLHTRTFFLKTQTEDGRSHDFVGLQILHSKGTWVSELVFQNT